ncbi:hypothetical protein COBT_001864 [Conglomerata obtusa]
MFVEYGILKFQDKYSQNNPLGNITNEDQYVTRYVTELIDFYLSDSNTKLNAKEGCRLPESDRVFYINKASFEKYRTQPVTQKNLFLNEKIVAKYYNVIAIINTEILNRPDSYKIQSDILCMIEKFRQYNNFYALLLGVINEYHSNMKYVHFFYFAKNLFRLKSKEIHPFKISFNLMFYEKHFFDENFDANIEQLVTVSKKLKNDILLGALSSIEKFLFFRFINGRDSPSSNKETLLGVKFFTLYTNMQKQIFMNEKPTILLHVLCDMITFMDLIEKNRLYMPEEAHFCASIVYDFIFYKNFLINLSNLHCINYDVISEITSLKLFFFSIEIQCHVICKILQVLPKFAPNLTYGNMSFVISNEYLKLKAFSIFMRNAFLSNNSCIKAIASYVQNLGNIQKDDHQDLVIYKKLKDELCQNLISKKHFSKN